MEITWQDKPIMIDKTQLVIMGPFSDLYTFKIDFSCTARLIKPHPSGEKSRIANGGNLPRIRQNRFKGPEAKNIREKYMVDAMVRFSRWMLRHFWKFYATFWGRRFGFGGFNSPKSIEEMDVMNMWII